MISTHTFWHLSVAISIVQQYMCITLPKVEQSAFTQASLLSLLMFTSAQVVFTWL